MGVIRPNWSHRRDIAMAASHEVESRVVRAAEQMRANERALLVRRQAAALTWWQYLGYVCVALIVWPLLMALATWYLVRHLINSVEIPPNATPFPS